MRRLLLTLCAFVMAAGLSAAGPAQASELGIGTTCSKYMDCSYVVRYAAVPGERNDVRVALTELGLVVSDAGADIRSPSNHCSPRGSHLMTCFPTPNLPIARIDVLVGDGDDRVDTSALVWTPVVLYGEAGDDVLIGGAAIDMLLGGPGSDALDGGAGRDLASYADHDDGVRADLHAGGVTNAAGERDALTGIESLRGGPGDDVLIGDRASNGLTGGGGKDDIRGHGGDDVLAGEGVLSGGAGNDLLRLKGPGRAVCGAGRDDQATASGKRLLVDDSCERLQMAGVTVGLHLGHRDPSHDRLAFRDFYVGVLVARLTTTAGRLRLLGSLRYRRPLRGGGRPILRLSAAGAAYVRRAAPLDVLLRVGTAKGVGISNVRLHIGRHRFGLGVAGAKAAQQRPICGPTARIVTVRQTAQVRVFQGGAGGRLVARRASPLLCQPIRAAHVRDPARRGPRRASRGRAGSA